mmetsp:Transcript_17264/g.35631  ORF Transcript_17264/g.35631 Transcript_17264/m.35631 type:complete len:98 (-) Transcript_17264:1543-1836(-)
MVILVSNVTSPLASMEAFTARLSSEADTTCALVSRWMLLSCANPYNTFRDTVPDENVSVPHKYCCWNSPKPLEKVQKHEKLSEFILGENPIAARVES